MIEKFLKKAGYMCLCGMMILAQPKETFASQNETSTAIDTSTEASTETSTEMLVIVEGKDIALYSEGHEDAEVVATLEMDSIYQIETTTPSGWVKVSGEAGTGYINADEEITVIETTQEESSEEIAKKQSEERRQALVEYGLQFVGGRYVYGGSDPHKGVDCSGFTKYVLGHGANVELSRSAASQAGQGRKVSAEEMRPGDLIFYSKGGRINHVAMYIGGGKVVHASTERTGIKVSDWNYRKPTVIRNVLGD